MPSEAAANGGAGSSSVPPAAEPTIMSRALWGMRDIGIDAETRKYLPLYTAAIKGDWESANTFILENEAAPTAMISIFNWTALHVACSQGHSTFVEKLIQQMPREALSLRDVGGSTALHYAAKSGSFKCVKALLDINPGLTHIADSCGHVPLVHAAKIPNTAHARQKDMVWQLCLVTKHQGPAASPFVSPAIFELLLLLIANEYLDIAFYLVKEYPILAAPCRENTEYYMLSTLIAHVPSAFQSQSRLGFWENIISYLYVRIPLEPENIEPRAWLHAASQQPNESGDAVPFCSKFIRSYIKPVLKLTREWLWRSTVTVVPALNRIFEEKSKHIYALELVKAAFSYASSTLNNDQMLTLLYRQYNILPRAAEQGILEIYTTCFEFFPDAIWLPANSGGALLQTCIKYRQEKIFNFFLESMAQTDWMCNCIILGDTTLHFAAKLAPFAKLKAISGSALQMQSELQWFKVVEKITHPVYNLIEDNNQRTAQKVFTEEHKELLEIGEKWMKDTTNSCMLVATLIATVVFAAAFTVPGGNNQDNGIPLFLQKTAFLIFAVSDALALFSSSTSILMFLSILTSRFGEEDFLLSLPRKLIIGLASLFFAIVAMMVAFGATLSIVLGHRFPRPWVTIPAVTLPACIPVGLFMMLQLPLFIQMVKSTFWSNIPWR